MAQNIFAREYFILKEDLVVSETSYNASYYNKIITVHLRTWIVIFLLLYNSVRPSNGTVCLAFELTDHVLSGSKHLCARILRISRTQ